MRAVTSYLLTIVSGGFAVAAVGLAVAAVLGFLQQEVPLAWVFGALAVIFLVFGILIRSIHRDVRRFDALARHDHANLSSRLTFYPEIRSVRWAGERRIMGELSISLINRSVLDLELKRYSVSLSFLETVVWGQQEVMPERKLFPAQEAHQFTVQFDWQPIQDHLAYIHHREAERDQPVNLGLKAQLRARFLLRSREGLPVEVDLQESCRWVGTPLIP